MKFKRSKFISSLLALFLLPLPMPAAVAVAEDVFKIGATVPLTGDLATYGNLIVNGIELAKEDLRKEGIQIELAVEDTPLVGAGVMSALNKLLTIDKIDAIAGNFSNPAMRAMGDSLEKQQIPAFHTAASDPAIVDFPKFVLSTNVRIKDEAYHVAEYVYRLGFRKVGVMTIQTNFGEAYRDFFEERFKGLGGQVVSSESFQIQDQDYRTQLTKLKAKNPELVFAACFGGFLGRVIKQSRDLGLQVPIYSVYESEDNSVLEASQGKAEGLRYFVTVSDKSGAFRDFRDRFLAKHNVEPGTFAANSYDATMLLGRTFGKCKRDKECFLRELYSTKSYAGVSGEISISADGIADKKFVLKEVRSGRFAEVTEGSAPTGGV